MEAEAAGRGMIVLSIRANSNIFGKICYADRSWEEELYRQRGNVEHPYINLILSFKTKRTKKNTSVYEL